MDVVDRDGCHVAGFHGACDHELEVALASVLKLHATLPQQHCQQAFPRKVAHCRPHSMHFMQQFALSTHSYPGSGVTMSRTFSLGHLGRECDETCSESSSLLILVTDLAHFLGVHP